jgi:hypothetical protein
MTLELILPNIGRTKQFDKRFGRNKACVHCEIRGLIDSYGAKPGHG